MVSHSIYYDYTKTTIWWMGTIIVFIILLIELKTALFVIKNTPKRKVRVLMLPILSYLFYFSAGVCALCEIHDIIPCALTSIAGNILYGMGKIHMYFVFIYRLYIIYSTPCLAYDTKILFIMVICIIVFGLTLITVSVATISSKIIVINAKHSFCITVLSFVIVACTAANDLITICLCSYLFIRPLLFIARQGNQMNNNNTKIYDIDTLRIVSKYCTLSVVSVLSTVIVFAVIGTLNVTGIIMIDVVINCICMMLFNQQYDALYIKLCCGAICVVSKIVNQHQNRNKQRPALSLHVASNTMKSDTKNTIEDGPFDPVS
eukprot:29457_1